MAVGISVVSHGHFELIKDLSVLGALSRESDFHVSICDNVGEPGFQEWCNENGIDYIRNKSRRGFGENNNANFHTLLKSEGLAFEDYFLVLNPDVIVEANDIKSLCLSASSYEAGIATIKLYNDRDFKTIDRSIRRFPSLMDFFKSYLIGKNDTIIDGERLNRSGYVDWAAGSFLLFTVEHFKRLGGFDEKYFMYCEDIDICLRSWVFYNQNVFYDSDIYAIHLARRASRSLFSKHFLWHMQSVFRYVIRKRCLMKNSASS